MALGYEHRLPRLDASCYRADATVLWTLTMKGRATGWLNDRLHLQWQSLLLHAGVRHKLICPVYTLMPDHIHLAWMGLSPLSDQRNAMAFLRTHVEPLLAPAEFQHQSHDHVLTAEERTRNAFRGVCEYIMFNPVRAGLVKKPSEWPYSGCIFPGYVGVTPFAEDYWEWFWRLYYKLRDPDCDKHVVVRRVQQASEKLKASGETLSMEGEKKMEAEDS
jgi:putative transposase